MNCGCMKKENYGYYIKNSREITLPLQAPIRRTAEYSNANVETIFEIKKFLEEK